MGTEIRHTSTADSAQTPKATSVRSYAFSAKTNTPVAVEAVVLNPKASQATRARHTFQCRAGEEMVLHQLRGQDHTTAAKEQVKAHSTTPRLVTCNRLIYQPQSYNDKQMHLYYTVCKTSCKYFLNWLALSIGVGNTCLATLSASLPICTINSGNSKNCFIACAN